jgi:type IV pilus biogenesis protein CpaD/CtpE
MKTVVLGLAISALVFGCAHERGDMAGVATTTSAVTTAPATSSLVTPGGCSTKLPHVLEFESTSATLSADERVEVQSWANCLQLPEMRDSTIVLLGPSDARDGSLFERRAADVREELVRRGVERSRIVIGTPNAARQGGRLGPSNGVLLEVSSSSTLRELEHR